jgi:hypothetical protein
MKTLAFIAVVASIALIFFTSLIYLPILDSPDATTYQRALIAIVLLLQLYFLFFSVYLSFVKYPVIKWETIEDKA